MTIQALSFENTSLENSKYLININILCIFIILAGYSTAGGY